MEVEAVKEEFHVGEEVDEAYALIILLAGEYNRCWCVDDVQNTK